jgi:hypothetical protein
MWQLRQQRSSKGMCISPWTSMKSGSHQFLSNQVRRGFQQQDWSIGLATGWSTVADFQQMGIRPT